MRSWSFDWSTSLDYLYDLPSLPGTHNLPTFWTWDTGDTIRTINTGDTVCSIYSTLTWRCPVEGWWMHNMHPTWVLGREGGLSRDSNISCVCTIYCITTVYYYRSMLPRDSVVVCELCLCLTWCTQITRVITQVFVQMKQKTSNSLM